MAEDLQIIRTKTVAHQLAEGQGQGQGRGQEHGQGRGKGRGKGLAIGSTPLPPLSTAEGITFRRFCHNKGERESGREEEGGREEGGRRERGKKREER